MRTGYVFCRTLVCSVTLLDLRATCIVTFCHGTHDFSARKKSRFATPVSEEEFCDAANGVVPLNTKKNNCWAQRTLNAWIKERNKVNPGSVPTDFLSCNDPVTVCKYRPVRSRPVLQSCYNYLSRATTTQLCRTWNL